MELQKHAELSESLRLKIMHKNYITILISRFLEAAIQLRRERQHSNQKLNEIIKLSDKVSRRENSLKQHFGWSESFTLTMLVKKVSRMFWGEKFHSFESYQEIAFWFVLIASQLREVDLELTLSTENNYFDCFAKEIIPARQLSDSKSACCSKYSQLRQKSWNRSRSLNWNVN